LTAVFFGCSFAAVLYIVIICEVDCIGAKSLRSKLAELQKSRAKVADGFDLGSLLHVRGNVTTYQGQREIKASQFSKSLLVTFYNNNSSGHSGDA